MLTPELNIKKELKELVESNIVKIFSYTKLPQIRTLLRKNNNCVLSLLMFYDHRKNMIFRALTSVVYCIFGNYVCVDYLCCLQTKLNVRFSNEGF